MPSPGFPSSSPPLLPGFTTARAILDGKHPVRSRVNFVGIVTDYRVPIPTRNEDWKCQLRLFDHSIEDDSESVEVNIFRPKDEMPTVRCGDVCLLFAITVQSYSRYMGFDKNLMSLLSNRETKIHVYEAGKIPTPPRDAACALYPLVRKQDCPPKKKENEYVSSMFHSIDKGRVPAQEEFEVMKVQSSNVKDKFCELKDAQEGRFCDIVAQIVKPPFDLGDRMTLWVSDYTENSAFFNYSFGGKSLLTEGRDGDVYGYTEKFPRSTQEEWPGPYGKRSMQITVYEPHASILRSGAFRADAWVLLQNVQLKYGHNANNLEGFLREDRGFRKDRLRLTKLDPFGDPETINPHLKPALRRKRDYERNKKEQLRDINQAAEAGQKRRADLAELEPKLNSKKRRKQNRAMAKKMKEEEVQVEVEVEVEVEAEAEAEAKAESTIVQNMNQSVRCENEQKTVSSVAEIVEPVFYTTTIDSESIKLQLPFVNANYRANVRVVDYMPSNLADFAIPKKISTEFDILSDNEDDSSMDSGPGTDSEPDTEVRDWEWRFFLQLEDAVAPPRQEKERVWVVVDNAAAQCLTGLDASNLRRDTANLGRLRENLFFLWGNLEEQKTLEETTRAKSNRADQPPEDSSGDEQPPQEKLKEKLTNLPFPCCIQQYGIKVRESDVTKADAGNGKRWERIFGLFGTRIQTG